jgi:hypothetical protein
MVNTGAGLLPAFNRASGAAGSVLSSATTDPTQGNIAAAGSYANNPYMAGMIRAAQTPIERQLNEVSIPNLNIGAAGTGNTDSSRSAMTEAILRRNAGIDESNVAANLQGNAYNSGLNLAEQARMGNMGAAINAGGLFSNVGNSGSNLITSGNNGQISDLNVPIQVDQMYQQDQQNQNNVNYQNANAGAQFPWQQLNNFWGIAGHPLGTNTTGSSTGSRQAPRWARDRQHKWHVTEHRHEPHQRHADPARPRHSRWLARHCDRHRFETFLQVSTGFAPGGISLPFNSAGFADCRG